MNVMLLLTALMCIIIDANAKTVAEEKLNLKDIVEEFVELEDAVKRELAVENAKEKQKRSLLGAHCHEPSTCSTCDCGPNTSCYDYKGANCNCKDLFKEVDGVCSKELYCWSWQFTCCRKGNCIDHKKMCDGKDDCNDNPNGLSSDEEGCEKQTKACQSWEIRCKSGKCINSYQRCDGNNDCGPGDDSDEACCFKSSQ